MLNFMMPNFWNVLRNVWFEEVRVNCMQVGCLIKTNNVRQLWTLAGHASGHLENLSGSTETDRQTDRQTDRLNHSIVNVILFVRSQGCAPYDGYFERQLSGDSQPLVDCASSSIFPCPVGSGLSFHRPKHQTKNCHIYRQ